MSRISFENYGKMAQFFDNDTEISGRYQIQENDERNILYDVLSKLDIKGENTLLDIGCGTGNLLIPLSFACKQLTGVDHASAIKRLKQRAKLLKNIDLISGNFFDLTLDRKFDKILCYSVLHLLSNKEEVFMFIQKSLKLLKPGGIALFGDIPNISKKERFLKSKSGREFSKKWNKLIENRNKNLNHTEPSLVEDKELVEFNDDLVISILIDVRAKGFDSFILNQHSYLPFGYTREDILIKNPY